MVSGQLALFGRPNPAGEMVRGALQQVPVSGRWRDKLAPTVELDAPIELGEAIAAYQTAPIRPRFFFFGAMLFWVERERGSVRNRASEDDSGERASAWLAGKRSTVPLLYSVCDI